MAAFRLIAGFLCVSAILLPAGPASSTSFSTEELRVLPENIDSGVPGDMTRRYLIRNCYAAWDTWKEHFETIEDPAAAAANQQRLRDMFVEKIGGFPERTPLNPVVAGVLERDGYHVEKIIFESQPHFFVTALLFLPAEGRFEKPYPGVLVPCGHADNAKAYETYQTMGAFLALNGMAALVFDPIEQGERMQLLDAEGKPRIRGTAAHTMVGVGAILLGRNTARFEIWDGMRGIDYLQSRPEVDPARIGITGNSGGGTQTSYLMSLDDRLVCGAPSCYLNSISRQLEVATGDAEQNIFGQLAWGMDHADYMMMRAPVPFFIAAATQDFFDIRATWESYRFAKRRYSMLGHSERIDILENDAPHNYNQSQREAVVRWLARWLQHRDEPITQPEITIFSDEELRCTPAGQVMLLDGARSVYELNQDCEATLAEQRRKLWETEPAAAMLDKVRVLAGIRRLADLPQPNVAEVDTKERDGIRLTRLVFTPEEGISLPVLRFAPTPESGAAPVLLLHEAGMAEAAKPDGPVDAALREGRVVYALDVRGLGETRQMKQDKFCADIGTDWEDYFAAYALGRSYVGMRAEDILVCARQIGGPLELHACGMIGVPALHAAALEPQLFSSVRIERALASWADVIATPYTRGQLMNTVHAPLTTYDLPDLARTLGDKLVSVEPLDAAGEPYAKH